jgi:hypothetical protein
LFARGLAINLSKPSFRCGFLNTLFLEIKPFVRAFGFLNDYKNPRVKLPRIGAVKNSIY